jgi:hypothetical protein
VLVVGQVQLASQPVTLLRQRGRHHRRLLIRRLARARSDQPTRDYLARRTADSKTRRETIRCISAGSPTLGAFRD